MSDIKGTVIDFVTEINKLKQEKEKTETLAELLQAYDMSVEALYKKLKEDTEFNIGSVATLLLLHIILFNLYKITELKKARGLL